MELTAEAVLALAPDPAAAGAGRKLATGKDWQSVGRSAEALWGECRGSAIYQVRVDRRDLSATCSCPSRKFPCKHSLGLLLLLTASPAAIPEAEPPAYVAEWLAKRAETAQKRQTTPEEPGGAKDLGTQAKAGDAQAKRAEKRAAQVRQGLETLDLWLCDLVRNGIADLEHQPTSFWEAQAARLVDAKAPAIAARLRRLAAIPGSGADWPARLLGEMGRLTLLIHAYGRIGSLDAALQDDLRSLIGWTLKEDEVAGRGESVADRWSVLGQSIEEEGRLRVQRSWLVGERSGRAALILQFSAAGAPFGQPLLPGTGFEATLAYWPGAYPQRALIRERRSGPTALRALPGVPTFEAFFAGVASALGCQPWLDRFPCVIDAATPLIDPDGAWHLRDRAGAALRLAGRGHWKLLALSGGQPLDLAGEWDGEALLPLGASVDGTYFPIWEAQ